MSAEKHSSPRGDLELLLCGPPKEEEAQVSFRPLLKVKNDPQALGRIVVDFGLLGQTGTFFIYPRIPPCRANFLNIRPRIKFLYTSCLKLKITTKNTFGLIPLEHIFRMF